MRETGKGDAACLHLLLKLDDSLEELLDGHEPRGVLVFLLLDVVSVGVRVGLVEVLEHLAEFDRATVGDVVRRQGDVELATVDAEAGLLAQAEDTDEFVLHIARQFLHKPKVE